MPKISALPAAGSVGGSDQVPAVVSGVTKRVNLNTLKAFLDTVGYTEVPTFDDLPLTVGTPAVGTVYLVRTSTGIWPFNRKEAGLYRRGLNTGAAIDWTRLGNFSEALTVYDADQDGDVDVAHGGTGASTVAGAQANLELVKGGFGGQIPTWEDEAPANSVVMHNGGGIIGYTGYPDGGLAGVTALNTKADSAATTAALALKAPLASPAFTGTPTGITKAHVGLGSVDNTADSAKPVSTAQAAALALKADASALTAHTGDATKHLPTVTNSTSLGVDGAGAWVQRTASQLFTFLGFTTLLSTLNKVTESAGLPLWNGSAWPGGSGEVNTASNVGTAGVGLFKAKSGVDLQFKKVKAGANITVTATGADEVEIASTASGGSADFAKVLVADHFTEIPRNNGSGSGVGGAFARRVGTDHGWFDVFGTYPTFAKNGMGWLIATCTGATAYASNNVYEQGGDFWFPSSSSTETWRLKMRVAVDGALPSSTEDRQLWWGIGAHAYNFGERRDLGFFVAYNVNGGRFTCKVDDGQNIDSGVALALDTIYDLEVVCDWDTDVKFYINGSLVGTTTTRPSQKITNCAMVARWLAGSTQTRMWMDYFILTKD
jgi:hypothetical protein